MSVDRCVSCGEVIPEGSQVCMNCMDRAETQSKCVGYIVRNGVMFIKSGPIEKMVLEFKEPDASEMRIWKEDTE